VSLLAFHPKRFDLAFPRSPDQGAAVVLGGHDQGVALLTVGVAQATACEKHLNGHQNSSETNSEVQSQ